VFSLNEEAGALRCLFSGHVMQVPQPATPFVYALCVVLSN
jgi:hypothetical protein